MFLPGFDDYRQQITTASADISYVDISRDGVDPGRPALFVHGIGTSAYVWADAISELADLRRCIAVDLPAHGSSPARADQEMTIGALAGVLAEFCDALHLDSLDLVANDTGGAIAQVLAGRNPGRLSSFVLTNTDTQGNCPPAGFQPTIELARSGAIVAAAPSLLADLRAARALVYGSGYQDPEFLTLEMAGAQLQAVLGTPAAAAKFQALIADLGPADLQAAEPGLRSLTAPTLIVWGTADEFFDVKWAHWLRDTIPGAREVVELDGAKLFLPHERAREFAAAVRRHWAAPLS